MHPNRTLYWSPTTAGFYDSEIVDDWPADAVEITPARHAELMAGMANGGFIVADRRGQPVVQAAPDPTAAELSSIARNRRDAEIAALRWLVDRHADQVALQVPTTLPADAFAALLNHIQALRDVPEQPGFPASIAWPTAPSFLTRPDQETT